MVIVVNTRLLQKGKLEGIGWFSFETLSRMTRNHPEHQFIFLFDRPYDDSFIFSENVKPVVVPPPTRHPFLWFFWFEVVVPFMLKKYKADLFLSPDGYLSLSTDVKQLAVIHDINFAHRPKDLPWLASKYCNHYFPKFARHATRIATVSNYSKEDILRTWQIEPGKIDVIYNGVNSRDTATSEKEKDYARQKYADGKPYFLFIGSLHPRKNISGLLLAYDFFRASVKQDIKMVIVGGEMFKTAGIAKTHEAMQFKNDVVFTGRLTVDDLHQVLGAALALVFVPFFEGFGIPVVEAMAADVPVICSNTTSLPEVGGDAVLYVDPHNREQIKEAMTQVSEDEFLRTKLIEKGREQQQKFSWDQSAERLWESIEKCAVSDPL